MFVELKMPMCELIASQKRIYRVKKTGQNTKLKTNLKTSLNENERNFLFLHTTLNFENSYSSKILHLCNTDRIISVELH